MQFVQLSFRIIVTTTQDLKKYFSKFCCIWGAWLEKQKKNPFVIWLQHAIILVQGIWHNWNTGHKMVISNWTVLYVEYTNTPTFGISAQPYPSLATSLGLGWEITFCIMIKEQKEEEEEEEEEKEVEGAWWHGPHVSQEVQIGVSQCWNMKAPLIRKGLVENGKRGIKKPHLMDSKPSQNGKL